MKKKGVSQLIATVLLIALVIVIAAVIFFWVRGFVSEQIEKFGKPAEQVCDEISFDATLNTETDPMTFYVFNKGNVPISDFSFKTYSGGNSQVIALGSGVAAGTVQTFSLGTSDQELPQAILNADRVIVIPDLKGFVKGTSKIKSINCDENSLGKLVYEREG